MEEAYTSHELYAQALNRAKPTATRIFIENVKQGVAYNSLIQAADWWKYKEAGVNEVSYSSQEEYEQSSEYNPLVEYRDDITPSQVEIIAKQKERDREFSWWMRNQDIIQPAVLGGMFIPGIAEPFAWLPVAPIASYYLKAGSNVKNVAKTGLLKKTIAITGAGMLSEAGYQTVLNAKKEVYQQDPDLAMAMTDIAFGGVMTASIYGATNIYNKLKTKTYAQRNNALSKALSDLDEDVTAVDVEPALNDPDMQKPIDPTQTDRTTGPYGPVERIIDGMKEQFNRAKKIVSEEAKLVKQDETVSQIAGGVRNTMERLVKLASNCVRRNG